MKYKLFTVVGARPQFIKASAINRAIRSHFKEELEEFLIHTGQHYDADMSEVFFQELGIDPPAYRLDVGSANHGAQTGMMLEKLEKLFLEHKPDVVLVYGDTNSTLAGALAASKLLIPVVHVEAGLRSFNKAMPEEINRILTDHVSTLLFAPTETAIANLKHEGFGQHLENQVAKDCPKVYHCGDVMYDNALFFKERAKAEVGDFLAQLGVEPGGFLLATIHRNANTDDLERLKSILCGLAGAAQLYGKKVVLPLHPRTRKMIGQFSQEDAFFASLPSEILLISPASYLQMTLLESCCDLVLTDSGGVQKEAYFFQKPCIVLRQETEWVELVNTGAAILADANQVTIEKAAQHFRKNVWNAPSDLYGDGKSARFIINKVLQFLNTKV